MDLALSVPPRVHPSLLSDKNKDGHKWMCLCYLLHLNLGLRGSYYLEVMTKEYNNTLQPENIRE